MHSFLHPLIARAATLSVVALAVLTGTPTGAVADTRVSNDDVENAEAVTALPYAHEVDLTGATLREDEPPTACDFVSNTVWYSVQLPRDTLVHLDSAGSGTDTVIAVFDDPSLQQPLACGNNQGEVLQAAVTFEAAAGTRYLVQVGVDGQTGSSPGLLRLTADVGERPTGKPAVDGTRFSSTFAGAFFHTPLDDGGYHNTQIDVSAVMHHTRSGDVQRQVDVQFSSRRSQLQPDGTKVNEEWYYAGAVDPAAVRLSGAMRDAQADLVLTVEHSHCRILGPDQEPVCTDLPAEQVTVGVTWTGVGDVHRDRLVVADRDFGYHDSGVLHEAWRDSAAVARVGGGLHQQLRDPFDAVLSRSSANVTWWTRR